MIIFFGIIFICVLMLIFSSAYICMFGLKIIFWEDDEVFRKIMNYIKIHQNKFKTKSENKFTFEIGNVKVSIIPTSYGMNYNVYYNDNNINHLLNNKQIQYICKYVNKIYLYDEKQNILQELKNY